MGKVAKKYSMNFGKILFMCTTRMDQPFLLNKGNYCTLENQTIKMFYIKICNTCVASVIFYIYSVKFVCRSHPSLVIERPRRNSGSY